MKKTTIKDAFRQIFNDPREGTFRREDLIDIVMRSGLGTWKRGSIIPSDYCYNRINKGIKFETQPHCFTVDNDGNYKVLGLNARYVGPIYHLTKRGGTPKLVGHWKEDDKGKCTPYFEDASIVVDVHQGKHTKGDGQNHERFEHITATTDVLNVAFTSTKDTQNDTLLGTELWGYQFISVVAATPVSTFYKVRHQNDALFKKQGYRMINLLNPTLGENKSIRALFEQTAVNTISISHKRLAEGYNLLESEDSMGVLMEYIEGVSARKLPILGQDKTFKLLGPMCEVLDYLSKNDVSCVNLRPEIIMVHKTRGPVLLEAGITPTDDTELNRTMAQLLSSIHLSPESLRGNPTDRSSQYSLALMGMFWLSGHLPWPDDTSQDRVVVLKLTNDLAIDSEIESKLSATLQKALSFEAVSRYTDHLAFFQALTSETGEESSGVTRTPKQEKGEEDTTQRTIPVQLSTPLTQEPSVQEKSLDSTEEAVLPDMKLDEDTVSTPQAVNSHPGVQPQQRLSFSNKVPEVNKVKNREINGLHAFVFIVLFCIVVIAGTWWKVNRDNQEFAGIETTPTALKPMTEENDAGGDSWELIFSADFDDNTWQDITLCQGCAGLGCPSVDNGSVYMNTDWMRLCISGGQLNSDVKVEYDLEVSTTEQFGIGFDSKYTNPGHTSTVLSEWIGGQYCRITENDETTNPGTFPEDHSGHWTIEFKQSTNQFDFHKDGILINSYNCENSTNPSLMPLWFASDRNVRSQARVDNIQMWIK